MDGPDDDDDGFDPAPDGTDHRPVGTLRGAGVQVDTARAGRVAVGLLLVALVAIEVTDLVFASDSIPAIFGITTNVFVIFTSNAFAVLGLRALYFVFAGAMDRFRYLKYGLAALLVFIGAKLLAADLFHVSTAITLGVIAVVIAASVVASREPAVSTPEVNRPHD